MIFEKQRKFNGKTYKLHWKGTSVSEAKIMAKLHRSDGHSTRIIKRKGLYVLYIK